MNSKRYPIVAVLVAVATVGLVSNPAAADEPQRSFSDLGYDLEGEPETMIELDGYFRSRGEILHNLDLDRGLTPSGEPLYPTPLGDSSRQTLRHSDMRLRTDLRAYSPIGAAAVNLRVDVFDNVGFGSRPDGPPQSTASQRPVETLSIKRAYAEALTPIGLLTVGRMGSHWGLGMLTHGGDELGSDSGDAADRVAFVTPMLGHIWAVAYDIAWSGPEAQRRAGNRTLDLDPADDARALTFAFMEYHTDESIQRRLDADRPTFNYGAYFSYRWQNEDVPAHYLPAAQPDDLSESDVMYRGFRAHAVDVWTRFVAPYAHVEAELAMMQARIDQASLIPGANFEEPIESLQFGGAIETEFGDRSWPVAFGIDAGFASGDPAPGFGAFPEPYDSPAEPGDLDGPQSDPPRDNRVDNFRFHPDYRVDQILFREIIGTVTDATYLRPHVTWRIGEWGPGQLTAHTAAIASWAIEPTSTPGQQRALGLEINPSIRYESYGNFSLGIDHGVLFPFAGLDNPDEGLSATPAQMVRLQVAMGF